MDKARICILGEFNENLDEGLRKTAYHLVRNLSDYHEILPIDIRDLRRLSFWRTLRRFKPEVIHYLNGSSLISFFLLKFLSVFFRSKSIISMTHPKIFPFSKYVIYFIRPDMILIQSEYMFKFFKSVNSKKIFLPAGGIDIDKYQSNQTKESLRLKYGISNDKFIILHVGHIKKGRNLSIFEKLQSNSNQVIIIGSSSTSVDKDVYNKLEKAGCIIWREYFDNIEEIYTLSDCYVFPVKKQNFMGKKYADSIELPLSVLEAMSCNLPIVTTKFGSLPNLFENNNGFFFVEHESEIIKLVNKIKNENINVETRKNVKKCSWRKISLQHGLAYSYLLGEDK